MLCPTLNLLPLFVFQWFFKSSIFLRLLKSKETSEFEIQGLQNFEILPREFQKDRNLLPKTRIIYFSREKAMQDHWEMRTRKTNRMKTNCEEHITFGPNWKIEIFFFFFNEKHFVLLFCFPDLNSVSNTLSRTVHFRNSIK